MRQRERRTQMTTDVTRAEVQDLVRGGAQLIDVRPEQEFGDEHIAGARHFWLKTLDATTTAGLDRDRATVVY
jgi:phage shock protein E